MLDIPEFAKQIKTDHFVGGERVKGIQGYPFSYKNPADDKPFSEVYLGGRFDIQRAVEAAREAYDHGRWPRLSARERGRILRRMAKLMRERVQYLGTVESLNVGKLLKECVEHEAGRAAENLEFFAGLFARERRERFEKETRFLARNGKIESVVVHEPIGVVGVIIPWNSPLMLGCWNIAPCLAAGNTCVLKPSPWAPLSLLQMGDIANDAGLPPGVLNIVPGDKDAGDALVRDKRIDLISFTGGPDAGRKINIANAETRFMPPILELGGKAPNIVFRDADFDFAIEGVARSVFRSQGQSCVAGSRLILDSSIYVEFLEELTRHVRCLKIGNQLDPATEIGPLITREHRERVEEYIISGINAGARLLAGGNRPRELPDGNFLEPAIFDRVSTDMRIWKEEIFGPVLVVSSFQTEEEAVALANDTEFGLSGNIWTMDTEKAMRVAAKLDTAMIWINGHFLRDLRAPFGGRKQSGYGRQGGEWSRQSFTQTKMICSAYYYVSSNPS